jgi:hypothetical protein
VLEAKKLKPGASIKGFDTILATGDPGTGSGANRVAERSGLRRLAGGGNGDFGMLLERALSPTERSRLGAPYTPRAYVERLVLPTVIEPLRADWDDARTAALLLVAEGKSNAARFRGRETQIAQRAAGNPGRAGSGARNRGETVWDAGKPIRTNRWVSGKQAARSCLDNHAPRAKLVWKNHFGLTVP